MENPINPWMDLGGKPTIFRKHPNPTPIWSKPLGNEICSNHGVLAAMQPNSQGWVTSLEEETGVSSLAKGAGRILFFVGNIGKVPKESSFISNWKLDYIIDMRDFYRGDYSKKVIAVLSMMTATGAKKQQRECFNTPTRDWSGLLGDIISRCKPLCETLFNLDLNPFQFPLAIGILWSTIKGRKRTFF